MFPLTFPLLSITVLHHLLHMPESSKKKSSMGVLIVTVAYSGKLLFLRRKTMLFLQLLPSLTGPWHAKLLTISPTHASLFNSELCTFLSPLLQDDKLISSDLASNILLREVWESSCDIGHGSIFFHDSVQSSGITYLFCCDYQFICLSPLDPLTTWK